MPGALYAYAIMLYNSHIVQHRTPLIFKLFEMRRCQAGHFLKLSGKMSYATIVHLVSDFSKVKLVVHE